MQGIRVTSSVAFYMALFCSVLRDFATLLVVPLFVIKLQRDGQREKLAVSGNTD
jgi:hypothetical protein